MAVECRGYRWVGFAGLLCACAAAASAAPLIKPPAASQSTTDGVLELDEPIEPLVPKANRTSSEEDRIAAVSYFAAGRMLEQQGDLSGALRRYQRAFRLDPSALSVVREIVQLAFSLGRTEEAVRYALKSVALDPEADPELVQRLSDHLAVRGEFADARQLAERAVVLIGADSKTLQRAVLARDLAELYVAGDDFQGAANSLDVLTAALQGRAGWSLNEEEKRELRGDRADEFWSRVGQVYLEAGRLDEADAAFQAAEKAGAEAGLLAYRRAQVLAARQQTAEALAALEAYFDSGETSGGTGPYEFLAKLLTDAGRAEESLPKLKSLAEKQPENLALGYSLAGQYRAVGETDSAEALYRQLLPKLAAREALVALIEIDREKQDWNDLIDLLGISVRERGDLEQLSQGLEPLCANTDALAAVWNAARARLPQGAQKQLDFDQALGLGLLALQAKQTDVAAEFFGAALRLGTPEDAPLAYLRWGFGLLEQDAYAEAATVFQQALDSKAVPEDTPDFRFHLSGALEMTGRTDEALESAAAAIEVAEARVEEMGDKIYRLYPRPAWVRYHAKRYAEARAAYEDLIRRFDNVHNSPVVRETLRDARSALSNLCVLTGDMTSAEEYLEEILDEYPDDVSASNDLGYLWVDQNKNLDRAQRMIELAVAAQPDNRAYRDSLGWLYFRQGKYEDAVRELEQAAQGDEPVDGVIYDHLGDAYAAAGRVDDARAAWTKAAEALLKSGETEKAAAVEAKAATASKAE